MEPLHISNEEESDDDDIESDRDDKSTKRKRVLAAKGLHLVPETNRRESVGKEPKAEARHEEILAEFKDKANEVGETSGDDTDVLNPVEAQLVASTLAEAHREELPGEQIDDAEMAEVDRFLELVEEGVSIEAAAQARQQAIGASPEEVARAEAEHPSHPPETPGAETQDIPLSVGEGGFNLPPPPPPEGPNRPNFSLFEGPDRPESGAPFSVPHAAETIENTHEQKHPEADYDRGNPAVTALVGGIIGYYLGKKRGRKQERKVWQKSEKKIKSQIEDINWQLKAKEEQIRKLAQEKVVSKASKPEATTNHVAKQSIFESRAAKQFESKIMPPVEDLRPSPVEAGLLHPTTLEPKLATRIEAAVPLIKTHETIVAKTAEAAPETNKMLPRNQIERQVQTLNHNELLRLSEQVSIEGSTLRQIYETHLIGERGLRRLVAEHLRGGDVKAMLKTEIVEHEIDFERDPAFRNAFPLSSGSPTPSNDPKSTLDKMVEAAATSLGGPASETAPFRVNKDAEQADEASAKIKHVHPILDGFLALLIVVLLAVIVLLLYKR